MNIKTKAVELRTSRSTTETGAIQKGEDFVRAYAMGFDVEDAVAILRLDGIYIQSFEIKDVKTLEGDHLARAVGRIVGKDGRTKYAIENTTKTRIVVAGGSKIHILGGFKEIGMARESVVSLMYVPIPDPTTLLIFFVTNNSVSASHQARCTATCGRSARVSRSGSRRKETKKRRKRDECSLDLFVLDFWEIVLGARIIQGRRFVFSLLYSRACSFYTSLFLTWLQKVII